MVTLNRETERKKMGSVFIIEEQVDYEGDTVVSIHATRQGALCVLDRKHAEAVQAGDWGLGEMQNGNFRVRDRVFQMTEKTLEA
jgi:hypothetical protein